MSAGYPEVFVAPGKNNTENESSGTVGRPTMDDDERNSDPGNSITGRQSKPSNPEGSEAQEE